MATTTPNSLPPLVLPAGVESHYITSPQNDLLYHYLSAGKRGAPLVLLYHGFPESSYCWRHVLPQIAAKGYYAVAPDTRGSGRTMVTSGASFEYTEAGTELLQARILANVRDTVLLIAALGYKSVHCLVGHDAGGVLVPYVALTRPDLIERLILASHPYTGPPEVGFDLPSDQTNAPPAPAKQDIQAELGQLKEPRKHYKWYYATEPAARELHEPTSGLADFLRNYYYLKSGSWPGNNPRPLTRWDAQSLAEMPYYYVMPRDVGMREACRQQLQLSGHTADLNPWINDEELACMAREWSRTGFRGAINWYRISTQPQWRRDLHLMAGSKIVPPTIMMLGRKDWGSYQEPGVLQRMGNYCVDYIGERWIEDAGHWMQQERPNEVASVILELCDRKVAAGGPTATTALPTREKNNLSKEEQQQDVVDTKADGSKPKFAHQIQGHLEGPVHKSKILNDLDPRVKAHPGSATTGGHHSIPKIGA